MPSRRVEGGSAFRSGRHTRIARAFESTTTSRQFSGRSSMTTSSSSDAAIRPRERCTTNTLGSGKPFDDQPTLGLQLRGGAGGRGTLRQKDDLPAPLGRNRGEARDDARLALVERFPEIVDGLDVPPQPALLARRHVQLQERRHFVGGDGGGLVAHRVRELSRSPISASVSPAAQPQAEPAPRRQARAADAPSARRTGWRPGGSAPIPCRRGRRRDQRRYEGASDLGPFIRARRRRRRAHRDRGRRDDRDAPGPIVPRLGGSGTTPPSLARDEPRSAPHPRQWHMRQR